MSRIDLGFAAYADALAGLLEDPATRTPLTVVITGPWGLAKRRWPRWWRLVCSPGQKNAARHRISFAGSTPGSTTTRQTAVWHSRHRWPAWLSAAVLGGDSSIGVQVPDTEEMLRFLQAKQALGHVLDRLLRYVPATVNDCSIAARWSPRSRPTYGPIQGQIDNTARSGHQVECG